MWTRWRQADIDTTIAGGSGYATNGVGRMPRQWISQRDNLTVDQQKASPRADTGRELHDWDRDTMSWEAKRFSEHQTEPQSMMEDCCAS